MSSTSGAESNRASMPISTIRASEISTSDFDADVRSDYSSSSASHSSSFSESFSDTSLKKWVPEGVYVPIHRRRRSGSNTTSTSASTAPASDSSSPPLSKTEFAPEPKARLGVYTRAELLALAPSSLIHASLRPLVTPALLAKHPRILRARGDGVVRALDMARQDSNSASTLHHQHPAQADDPNFARRQQSSDVARLKSRVDAHAKKQSASALLPAPGLGYAVAMPQGSREARPGTLIQPRASRRRDRGRRRANVAYQRNFAQQASPSTSPAPSARSDRAKDTSANLGPSSSSPSPSLSSTPTPEKNVHANAMETTSVPSPRANTNRHRRQRLDVAVLNSWRTPQAVAA